MENIKSLEANASTLSMEGKHAESLAVLETLVALKKATYGPDSIQYEESLRQICEETNKVSQLYLKQGEYTKSLEILKQCEFLCDNNDVGKSIAYSNLAAYYRKVQKNRASLSYLEKALQIQYKSETLQNYRADTHLNICAVLSHLNRHDLALHHAQSAVIIVQETLLSLSLHAYLTQITSNNTSVEVIPPPENQDQQKDPLVMLKDRMAVLSIAYHNMGVEFEYLKQQDQSIACYVRAKQFANSYLGPHDGLSENMTNVFQKASEEFETIRRKQAEKEEKRKNTSITPTRQLPPLQLKAMRMNQKVPLAPYSEKVSPRQLKSQQGSPIEARFKKKRMVGSGLSNTSFSKHKIKFTTFGTTSIGFGDSNKKKKHNSSHYGPAGYVPHNFGTIGLDSDEKVSMSGLQGKALKTIGLGEPNEFENIQLDEDEYKKIQSEIKGGDQEEQPKGSDTKARRASRASSVNRRYSHLEEVPQTQGLGQTIGESSPKEVQEDKPKTPKISYVPPKGKDAQSFANPMSGLLRAFGSKN